MRASGIAIESSKLRSHFLEGLAPSVLKAILGAATRCRIALLNPICVVVRQNCGTSTAGDITTLCRDNPELAYTAWAD